LVISISQNPEALFSCKRTLRDARQRLNQERSLRRGLTQDDARSGKQVAVDRIAPTSMTFLKFIIMSVSMESTSFLVKDHTEE
jgi:hypothetical protein